MKRRQFLWVSPCCLSKCFVSKPHQQTTAVMRNFSFFSFFFLSLGNRELLSVCCLWAICSCCLKNGAATEREALSKHDRPCISIKLESVTNITSLCSYEAGEKTGSLRRDCNKSITSILFIYFYLLRPSASWLSQSQWRGEILTFFIWNYV